jgi:rod shape determining protein RodA
VYASALAAMLFVSGTPWRQLALLGSLVALVVAFVLWIGPAAGVNVLHGYQKSRLTCFVHPQKCTVDARYNLEQSIAAVGSGEFHGRGPRNATQTRLNFLPEHGTDFVFASFAEQRGFVGASLLLALYLLVLWRGLRIVTVARDLYSAVVAGGIVVALLFQIFVNIGMTMGIAPITGIPLPFVSVGGSSMIANLAAMGILLAIHARGRVARNPRRR